MWVTRSLDRARRRLRSSPPPREVREPTAPPDPDPTDNVVVALGRPELDRFVAALTTYLDPTMPRPDSPARLAGALVSAIERVGGRGRPTVTRSPAGLYTPEYWHVRIEGANPTTRAAVERLAAGRSLA